MERQTGLIETDCRKGLGKMEAFKVQVVAVGGACPLLVMYYNDIDCLYRRRMAFRDSIFVLAVSMCGYESECDGRNSLNKKCLTSQGLLCVICAQSTF